MQTVAAGNQNPPIFDEHKMIDSVKEAEKEKSVESQKKEDNVETKMEHDVLESKRYHDGGKFVCMCSKI